MSTVTQTAQILTLAGMTCDACAATVKSALEAVPGVIAANVSLADQRATIVMQAQVSRRQLVEAIEQAGYQVT